MGFARVYTLPTPYAGTELFDIGFEQAADVMYLAHVSHPPYKLSRYGSANWTLNPVSFGTTAQAPTGVTATPVGSTSDAGYTPKIDTYVVTTIDATTGQESLQSSPANATNDLSLAGHYNHITWNAVPNADRYRVYKVDDGVTGYIGSTTATQLDDDNISADTGDTPPDPSTPFVTNNYPGRVAIHQQRTVYGRTNTHLSGVYTSRSADLENLNSSFPTKAADALTFQLVARQVNAIQHFVSLNQALVTLTQDSVISITGADDGTLKANDAPVIRVQGYRGASRVRPVVVDDVIFFSTYKGSAIRTLGYTFETDGYKGNDLTVYAPHFFRDFYLVDMAWAEFPTSAVYCTRSDGKLVVLTWQAEQNVWGWSLLELPGGIVESVAVTTVSGEDIVFMVVRRGMRRFVERLGSSLWQDHTQAVFLDCALTYSGSPAMALTGFQHLEGQAVEALADGFHLTDLTVTNGKIVFPTGQTFSNVVIGLPFESRIKTLPFATAQTPTQGRRRILVGAQARVLDSCGLEAWATASGTVYDLLDDKRLPQPIGAPELTSGFMQVDAAAAWDDEATVTIRQRGPFPMQVLVVAPSYEVGG